MTRSSLGSPAPFCWTHSCRDSFIRGPMLSVRESWRRTLYISAAHWRRSHRPPLLLQLLSTPLCQSKTDNDAPPFLVAFAGDALSPHTVTRSLWLVCVTYQSSRLPSRNLGDRAPHPAEARHVEPHLRHPRPLQARPQRIPVRIELHAPDAHRVAQQRNARRAQRQRGAVEAEDGDVGAEAGGCQLKGAPEGGGPVQGGGGLPIGGLEGAGFLRFHLMG